MSLNHIEEQTSRKSFETIFFKQKSEQTSYFPSIDKKTPKAYNLKSTSTIISNNEKTENGLSKYIKNPETFYKEINQRLVIQKKEIEKRNEMITTLQKNFDEIRLNFLREKNENLEKTRQIQNLKQNINLLNSEMQNSSPKLLDNEKNSKLQKENDDLKNLIKDLEFNLKKQEEEAQSLFNPKNELEIVKKDLELTIIHNEELQNILKSSKEKVVLLESELDQQRGNVNLINEMTQEKNETMIKLNKLKQDQNIEIDSLKTEFSQRLLKKEEEVQALKSEMMDLNYKIRRKEMEFIEIKRFLQNAKENEEKLKLCRELIAKEKEISEDLRKHLEALENENSKLKNEVKNEKVENYFTLEKQITKNFKNVNEEIKNLKNKIDVKIEKHLTKKPSLKNNLESNEEKIKNLTQINSNLTSFILILQNRLKSNQKVPADSELLQTKIEENVIKNLSCCKCHLLLNNAVTCIPCGHSYCQDCKSGYNEYCLECGKTNGEVDAAYRNVLMDDMINMMKSLPKNENIKNLKNFL